VRTRRALVGGVVSALTLAGCTTGFQAGQSETAAVSTPAPARTTDRVDPVPVPQAPEASPEAEGVLTTVTAIVDGDTIETEAGTVRIIGIDTPERDYCGYNTATENLAAMIPTGTEIMLIPVVTMADVDRYGRLLRYVDTLAGTDVGAEQIGAGLAIARYDSRDGYGTHPREHDYVALDESAASVTCDVAPVPLGQPAGSWVCSYSPSYDGDWHNDVLCTDGTDQIRPYLREWDSFVTEDEIMESARDYESELNAG